MKSLASNIFIPLALTTFLANTVAYDSLHRQERIEGKCYGGTQCLNTSITGNDVEVVVAYCKHSLDFLGPLLDAIKLHSLLTMKVTVISWCDKSLLEVESSLSQISPLLIPTPKVVLIKPPIPSPDYCWAYFFENNYASLASRLFMVKDSGQDESHYGEITAKVLNASSPSFVCATSDHFMWIKRTALRTLARSNALSQLSQAPRGSVHSILLQFKIFSQTFLPVCYGSYFATTGTAVRRVAHYSWANFLQVFSEVPIQLLERLWAALLTKPLTITYISPTANFERILYAETCQQQTISPKNINASSYVRGNSLCWQAAQI